MKIEAVGKYRLTHLWSSRGPTSISHWPVGKVFEITQIDNKYNKVIGPAFLDWENNDIPCEHVELESA